MKHKKVIQEINQGFIIFRFVPALPQFVARAEKIVARYFDADNQVEGVERQDADDMIDACTLIHDAVGEIRRALLMNRNPEDVDSDNEYEEGGHLLILLL